MKEAIGILVNDVHLTKDNGLLVQSIFEQLTALCAKKRCKRIFCGGDVFTNRSGQPLSCLIQWSDIITELAKKQISLYIIPGNHDKTNPDAEESYLDVFHSSYVRLFRSGWVNVISRKLVVAMIPYFTDERWLQEYERVEEMVEANFIDGDIDRNAKKILISHSGFDGVMNNDGSRVESIIKPSMFKDWDKVLLGHYHNASQLSDNVFYTGSAYQNNFGENITDKGFTVIYEDASMEFVPSRFPKYIKEVINVKDKVTLRNLIEKYEGDEENFIRFQFVGSKVDFQAIDTTEITCKGIDVKFQNDETTEAMQVAESDSVMCYDKQTIKRDFINFCKENNIKGKMLSFGLNLIKNV